MDNPPAVISPKWWVTAVVVLAVAVGIVALWRIDRSGREGSGLGDAFQYPIDEYKKIDPALIHYEKTGEFATKMERARAVAVGPEDRIYVAGDKAVHVFDAAGTLRSKIGLEGRPSCLAVGGPDHAFPGRMYVGVGRRIVLLTDQDEPAGTWEVPGEKPQLTSIAAARDDVFVADCSGRVVLRFDTAGELIDRIGLRDEERGIPGFVIPSPFFDVAAAPDGLLWVVNPGALRLEAYSPEGNLELFWKKEGSAGIEGFFGCCNPAHFAVLPDGRFVTAEKGLVRVKVYSPHGQLECVVAGPGELGTPSAGGTEDLFDHEHKAVDVAADSRGRIVILETGGRNVRIYELKESSNGKPKTVGRPEQEDGPS